MKKTISKILLSLVIPFGVSHVIAQTAVYDLSCEYRKNPIGIDISNPRLSWKLKSEKDNIQQTAYEIRVADNKNDLYNNKNLIWSSGKVNTSQSILIDYNGPSLESGQRVYWQVRVWDQNNKKGPWSEVAFWESGIMDKSAWNKASWISAQNEGKIEKSLPSQYYRKEFTLNKKIKRARIYSTALGVYMLYINGKRIGDDYFAPGWTSYNKRIQYQTYDITNILSKDNAIGVIVGDGWYRGRLAWQNKRAIYGNRLGFIACIDIEYNDNTSEKFYTDSTWKYSYGPIISSDIYNGEVYDYNKELTGWNVYGYDETKWQNVDILNNQKNHLIATVTDLPREIMELSPEKIFKTPKKELVIDLGQNMVGMAKVKIKGNKGDTVKISYAEVLDKNGNFYTANLRSAKATDCIILKDNKEITFQPHFTFHGFRYIKIEGLKYIPEKDDIRGIVIHSPMERTGYFTCSDSLVNQLQSNIEWGQRDNFLDVPTDCPQRDERLGWTGDAQVFSMTAAYNFNVATFYTKWLQDLSLDQKENGKVPHIVPNVLEGAGSTAWSDAAIIVPWTVYRIYGDKRILVNQYESMKKWVEYMEHRAGKKYLWQNDYHFGDWLAYASTRSDYTGATTEKDLIANAYFRYSSLLLSRIAMIIGKTDDSKRWLDLSENVKKAFINEYVTPSGRLVSNTQTAYLLALSFDLLPEHLKKNAAKYLAKDVNKFKHLTTGFVGTPLLCSTLSEIGRDDLAFMLLMRKKYPSWLYPVTMGATTIWERWDGIKPDGTFQTIGMNSFNHYSYGAIGEWMYNRIAGICLNPEFPAYKRFTLNPHVGGGLTYARGEFESMHGKIVSDWKVEDNNFIYTVTIPANTSADVILPTDNENDITVNNKKIIQIKNIKYYKENNNIKLYLMSGNYIFKIQNFNK